MDFSEKCISIISEVLTIITSLMGIWGGIKNSRIFLSRTR